MKTRLLILATASLLVKSVAAQMPPPPPQDPCQVLGIKAPFSDLNGSAGCIGNSGFPNNQYYFAARTDQVSLMLAARTITELRSLISEIQGLRAEMRDYKISLTQAKASLDATTKATTESQEAWRKTALQQTLADVERIPARMASDNGLRLALLALLREELPKDSQFIQAVREAAKP